MIKFRSLRSKFTIIVSSLLVFIFVGQSITDIRTIETRLREGIDQEAKAFSHLSTRSFIEIYERYYISGFRKFKDIVEDTLKLSDSISRVRLVDMEGRIRFDTKDLKRKEIKELEAIDPSLLGKARKLEPSFTYKNEKKNILSEIVYPFVDEWGRHEYSIIYSVSYEAVQKEVRQSVIRATLLTLLLLILSVSMMNFLIIRITGPLSKLREGARIVGEGDLDYKLKIKTGDEIEEVAYEFNKMTEGLKESREKLEEAKESLEMKVKERTKELEEAKDTLEIRVEARTKELKELSESLEEKVKERTKELRERLEELEKFHRVTVGRELKMVELKEKIKKLEEELKKYKGRK